MDEERSTKRFIVIFVIIIVVILIIVFILTIRYKNTATVTSTGTTCSTVTPPTGLVGKSAQVTDILVTWNPSIGASFYKIYLGTVPGFSRTNSIASFSTAQTTYTITGEVLGRTYFVRVASVNACSGESILSDEVDVTLGFPPKFMIVSKDQPTLALRIAPDFQNIIVDNLCSGVGSDDLCIWQYNTENGAIESVSTPTNCMKTWPASTGDLRVKYGLWSEILFYNYASARQWVYDTASGTLCNPLNSEGLNCIKISSPSIPGQSTVRVPFDGTTSMQWTIIEA